MKSEIKKTKKVMKRYEESKGYCFLFFWRLTL